MSTRSICHRCSRAFTLVELLVVISIFLLVLAIAVPAFSSMMYSSEQSLAENALKIAMGSARDAAIRNASGDDTAAVFTFEPGGRIGIVACQKAGVIHDISTSEHLDYEIFVPVRGIDPVQLPRGWSVRGYARPGTIDDPNNIGTQGFQNWYADTYPTQADRDAGNWIFPETGFYIIDDATFGGEGAQGLKRHTFMVRFEGGTGQIITNSSDAVRVLLPSPSSAFRTGAPWTNTDTDGRAYLRADQADDLFRFVRRILASAPKNASDTADRATLLGPNSTDTVSAKSVGQLVLYSESRLASALGARLDRDTGSLYKPASKTTPYATWVSNSAGSDWTAQNTKDLNSWLEGRLLKAGAAANSTNPEDYVESDARVFAMQRYLGGLVEVTGTVNGQGVSQ
jgi:prepilin-type N-terminal cleavage/methylation domain-containing protein